MIFLALGMVVARGDDVLFSSLGLNGLFTNATANGILVENYTGTVRDLQSVAMPFSVTANGTATSLLIAFDQAPMFGVSAFGLTLSLVQGNSPSGTVLESVHDTILVGFPTLLTFDLAGTTTLVTGEPYWLVARADTNSAVTWYVTDVIGANSQFSGSLYPDDWNFYGGILSLQVNGNIDPVPEPANLILAALLPLLIVKKTGRK